MIIVDEAKDYRNNVNLVDSSKRRSHVLVRHSRVGLRWLIIVMQPL